MDSLPPVSALSRLTEGLPVGATIDGEVVAVQPGGSLRVSLAGVLMDILAKSDASPGDAARATVETQGGSKVLVLDIRSGATASDRETTPSPNLRGLSGASLDSFARTDRTSSLHMATAGGAQGQLQSSRIAVPFNSDFVKLVPRTEPTNLPASVASPDDAVSVELTGTARVVLNGLLSAESTQAGSDPMPPAQRAAISAFIPQAAANQASLAPLMADAAAALASSSATDLPPEARSLLRKLVDAAPQAETLSGDALRQAIERAGPLLEATIAARAASPTNQPLPPDTKATLMLLKYALASFLGTEKTPLTIAERPALPRKGTAPLGQKATPSDLPVSTEPGTIAKHLLERVDGALDRIRLSQAASLPDERDEAAGQRAPLLVELPIALRDGTMPVIGLAIGREDRRQGREGGTAKGWSMRVSLDLDEAGAIEARLGWQDDEVSITLFATESATAEALLNNLPHLRRALEDALITVEGMEVHHGSPPSAPPMRTGFYLDRRT